MFNAKLEVEISRMFDYVKEYILEVGSKYKHYSVESKRDKIILITLIFNNELTYHIHHNRLKYDDLKDDIELTLNKFKYNHDVFTTDRNRLDIAKSMHKKRVAKINSKPYRWWKYNCQLALKNYKYCAKCKSKVNLEIDHIVPRAINPDIEFDLLNSQYLCANCNSVKSALNCDDYRSKEIKDAQLAYIGSRSSVFNNPPKEFE